MTARIAEEFRSYWHATADRFDPADSLPERTGVVVVGGGMLGCWTAYWLAREGADVTLLEQQHIAWGATGRNGGILGAGVASGLQGAIDALGRDGAETVWKISVEGRDLAKQIIEDEGIACDYVECGSLSLALSDEEDAQLNDAVTLLAEFGYDAQKLTREAVAERINTPLGPDIAGAVFHPESGKLHSGKYLAGVAAAAARHGAKIVKATVQAVDSTDDGVIVLTSEGPVRAESAVLALNAWTDRLVPEMTGKIVPVRGQILAYEPMEEVFTTVCGASVTPTGEYWQQTADGSIVLGGCRADAEGGDVNVREITATGDVVEKIEALFPRLFPGLEELKTARTWAGSMAFTTDYLPVVDAVPRKPGVWFGGGFNGHGMPFGPRVGQLLARAALTGTKPVELEPLNMNRPSLRPMTLPDYPG